MSIQSQQSGYEPYFYVVVKSRSIKNLTFWIPKEPRSVGPDIRKLLRKDICVDIEREQYHTILFKLRMRHGVIGEPVLITKIRNLENLFLIPPRSVRRL